MNRLGLLRDQTALTYGKKRRNDISVVLHLKIVAR